MSAEKLRKHEIYPMNTFSKPAWCILGLIPAAVWLFERLYTRFNDSILQDRNLTSLYQYILGLILYIWHIFLKPPPWILVELLKGSQLAEHFPCRLQLCSKSYILQTRNKILNCTKIIGKLTTLTFGHNCRWGLLLNLSVIQSTCVWAPICCSRVWAPGM